MENSEYNIDISPKAYNKTLDALINKIYKLLPIYEGRDRDGYISISAIQAYNNFSKNLKRVILEVSGAEKIWFENSYYTEIYCLLVGLEKEFAENQHSELKSTIMHCIALCKKMRVDEEAL